MKKLIGFITYEELQHEFTKYPACPDYLKNDPAQPPFIMLSFNFHQYEEAYEKGDYIIVTAARLFPQEDCCMVDMRGAYDE